MSSGKSKLEAVDSVEIDPMDPSEDPDEINLADSEIVDAVGQSDESKDAVTDNETNGMDLAATDEVELVTKGADGEDSNGVVADPESPDGDTTTDALMEEEQKDIDPCCRCYCKCCNKCCKRGSALYRMCCGSGCPSFCHKMKDSEVVDATGEMLEPAMDMVDDAVEKAVDTIEEIRDQQYSGWECTMYFLFLINVTVMAVVSRGGDIAFGQTMSIRQSIVDADAMTPWNDNGERIWRELTTVTDIYNWFNEVGWPFILRPEDDWYVMGQQRVLGGVRIRQVRMPEMDCERDEFDDATCYDNGGEFDNSDYTCYDTDGTEVVFQYRTDEDLLDQSYKGKYGSYEGGGYVVDIPLNVSYAYMMSEYLQNISWIDAGTRFITVDFNTFNPSTNLHTLTRLYVEMPTGGVFPGAEVKTWRVDRYQGSSGPLLMALHFLFAFFVLIQTLMEFKACWSQGCLKCCNSPCKKCCKKNGTYWGRPWQLVDMMNLFFFYVSIYLFLNSEIYRTEEPLPWYDLDEYQSFRKLQYGFTMESYCNAINGLLLWIKLFKYLAIHKRLQFLFTMLGHSSTDLLMFAIVLFIFVIAFGTAGFMTFKSDVSDFRSYGMALVSMGRFTVTEMDGDTLMDSTRMWGSLFYFGWSLIMLLILANVFIAILSEAYAAVQADMQDEEEIHFNVFGKVQNKLRDAIASKIGKKMDKSAFDADDDGKVSAKELAMATGITEEKAMEIIQNYDENDDGLLDSGEFETLKQAIIQQEELRQRKIKELRAPVSTREFRSQIGRLGTMMMTVLEQTNAGRNALAVLEQKHGPVGYHKATETLSSTMAVDLGDLAAALNDEQDIYS